MNKEFALDEICNYIKDLDEKAKTLEEDPKAEDKAKEARQKYSDALFITLFWLLTLKPEEAAEISKRLINNLEIEEKSYDKDAKSAAKDSQYFG